VIEAGIAAREGLVRLCYVEGLRRNPRLEGRLAARFVIGADGVLSLVFNGGTDLSDGRTVQCLLDTFRGLAFPRPEAGIVAVIYPIVLEPAPGVDTPAVAGRRRVDARVTFRAPT